MKPLCLDVAEIVGAANMNADEFLIAASNCPEDVLRGLDEFPPHGSSEQFPHLGDVFEHELGVIGPKEDHIMSFEFPSMVDGESLGLDSAPRIASDAAVFVSFRTFFAVAMQAVINLAERQFREEHLQVGLHEWQHCKASSSKYESGWIMGDKITKLFFFLSLCLSWGSCFLF